MNIFAFLLAGHNIPFLVSLGCAVVLAALQIASGFGDHDADADLDASGDAGLDAHGQVAHGEGALALLGIGRLPLMLVLMAFLLSFGALGLLLNALIGAVGWDPSAALLAVLPVSALAAFPLTGRISRLLARAASRSTTAISHQQLVGRVGTVVSPSVSASYGRVAVRDVHGTLHTVFAVTQRSEPLPERTEVALLAYDESQRRFIVRSLE
jgi:membrane protein implicated in regulation of membrane protease activity